MSSPCRKLLRPRQPLYGKVSRPFVHPPKEPIQQVSSEMTAKGKCYSFVSDDMTQ